MRKNIAKDSFMKKCAYFGCTRQDIEWEHVFLYCNKQINEPWAIIPLCSFHHRGKGLDKRYNEYIALQRATDDDLAKYPKSNWNIRKSYLATLYGKT